MSLPGAHSQRVLVFEPEHGGHQPAWVRMLAEWLMDRRPHEPVTFAVGEGLVERLRTEDGFDLRAKSGIEVLSLAPDAISACCNGPLFRRSLRRMALLRSLIRRTGASHAVVLFLDPMQLALALGLRLPGRATLSGILFRPSVHLIYQAGKGSPVSERLRDARKRWLYRLMLRNSCLERVLTLDPYFPPFAAEELGSSAQVSGLPDPIVNAPETDASSDCRTDLRDAVGDGQTLFTLFGSLTERKGVLHVLDALALLPQSSRRALRVVLAGKIDSAVAAEIQRRVEAAPPGDAPNPSLRIVDRYLTTAELGWLVRQSSVVLAPYQRFVGSSGVLNWAAAARKPVIAQAYGLVGALVRDYGLGLAVDTSDPARIAEAMLRLSQPEERDAVARAARWQEFCSGRSSADFAAAVFAGLVPAESDPT